MQKTLCFWGLLALCVITACKGQSGNSEWTKHFKRPAFVAPALEVQQQLRIPYWDGQQYGICDYKGKIVLQPQFDDIEMTAFDLPFVKAQKDGKWSLFDYSGKQIVPFSIDRSALLNIQLDYAGSSDDNYRYVAKIQDPRESYLKPLPETSEPGATVTVEHKGTAAPRYYFFTPETRQPLQSWFMPDDRGYMAFSQKNKSYNGAFTNSVNHGFIKVMDENRRFTLLDKNTQPLFPPAFNCAAISPTQVLILKENGFCALRDVKNGWQTDFIYQKVEATANPNICLAFIQGTDKPLWFKLDAHGRATAIDGPEAYLPLNERYSRIAEKAGEFSKKYFLWDEKTGQKVRELKNPYPEKIFEMGFGITQNGELYGIETIAGDTILKPTLPNYNTVGDSVYTFSDGKVVGLANRQNAILFQTEGTSISDYGNGYFQVSKNNGKALGIIRSDGHLVLPVEFTHIYPMRRANCLLAQKDGRWGMFDWHTGATILPVQFEALAPNGTPFWCGGGIEMRIGTDVLLFSPQLEVIHQPTEIPFLTKKDFPLKNATAAAKADFEQAQMPMYFSPYCVFKGNNWLHFFKCTGEHITSLEGFDSFEMVHSRHTISNQELGNAALTGVAKLYTTKGKSVWIRLEDGVLYQKQAK